MGNIVLRNETDLKLFLAKNYQKQINNYFGDDKKALKFLSAVVSEVQRNPKLLECDPTTLINSFMVMAQFELMPSSVSGEAYVLPYKNKGVMEAQFQLGYQGLVTLFYRAGIKSIIAEIVYEKDKFSFKNGEVGHEPDVFAEDRGKPIGAYVIVQTQHGGKVAKVMKKEDILNIGRQFSKSYFEYDYKTKKKTDNIGKYTPWNDVNDPELWMWKKTVLKQAAKLVPKNETIFKAISEDNKESNISERMEKVEGDAESLKMGNLIKQQNEKTKQTPENNQESQGEQKN